METRDTQQQMLGTQRVLSVGEAGPARVPTWLMALTVLLALGVVSLGAWMLTDRASRPDVVTAAVATARADAEAAAMNAGDMTAYGAFFAEDAVFDDRIAGEVLNGRDEIVARAQQYYDRWRFSVTRTSDVVMAADNVAIYGFTYGTDTDRNAGLMMVTFEDGEVSQETAWSMENVTANV